MTEEDFGGVVEENVHYILEQVHTCLPGSIVSYDGSLATVQPGILKQYKDQNVLKFPAISGVPVAFNRTPRSGLSFDLLPGDTGIIVFAERNIDNWVLSGLPQVPADSGKFCLNDAFFIPGVFPKTVPDTQYKPLKTVLYRNDIGTVNFSNALMSHAALMQELCLTIMGIITVGGPTTQAGSPSWIALMETVRLKFAILSGTV